MESSDLKPIRKSEGLYLLAIESLQGTRGSLKD